MIRVLDFHFSGGFGETCAAAKEPTINTHARHNTPARCFVVRPFASNLELIPAVFKMALG
jgi:hypothetical protein